MAELLTDKEVADYLRLAPKTGFTTVRKWVKQGKLRGAKAGDFWRFRKEDVDDMIFTATRKYRQ